jgi:asparagine synthase (glutamine-hydrolysing)
MSNFLVVLPARHDQHRGEAIFHSGLEVIQEVIRRPAAKTITHDWSFAATFPRRNGSGGRLVCDEATGSWLLTTGTWFHEGGYASGAEEALLHRFLEVGAERLGRELEGFFVVVVGDGRTREVVALTDVVGSCHCFVRTWDDVVTLSSSSFVLAALEEPTLDPVACQEFLGTGVIYEQRTLYREVRKLSPASVHRFSNGASGEVRRYWRITDVEPESLDGAAAVYELGETVQRAARKVAQAFPRLVCDLTGGYDSRVLTALFQSAGARFSTVVAGPGASPDVRVARTLAQVAGFPHLHIPPLDRLTFRHLEDAFALTDGEFDLTEYARILDIHRRLAQTFDISLNGSFGEVARGYWWELLAPHVGARRPLDKPKIAKRRYAAQPYDLTIFPAQSRLDLVSHFAEVIERTNDGLTGLPNTIQMNHAYLMMRMQRWQGRIGSSTDRLWPCLPPFLFRSVLEVMLRTSARLSRRSLLVRRLLAEYRPELAAVPLEHGHPALPFTWRTAHRFWPLAVRYGGKVMRKLLAKTGHQAAPGTATPRLQLAQDDEVRELLHPPTMRLNTLADPVGLANFLHRSGEPGFRYDAQWARVLTLEITLRKLAERINPRSAERKPFTPPAGQPLCNVSHHA